MSFLAECSSIASRHILFQLVWSLQAEGLLVI
jgi:hypothetical protein